MSERVWFSVTGLPAAQGSKTAFRNQYTGKINMVEGSTRAARMKFGEWRQAVIFAARVEAQRYGTLDGELHVALMFYLHKPASMAKRKEWCSVAPDVDKLMRAVFDALKLGTLIADDSRVVYCGVGKRYAIGRQPGVDVTIVANPEPEQAALFDAAAG
jgi:Holliday junction resolvase RusA-like endonuclease